MPSARKAGACGALSALAALAASVACEAADARIKVSVREADLPAAYRVDGGLYVTARQALRIVKTLPGVVLIDVRTHEETLFNGVATSMHRHVPYVIPDFDHSYDAKAKRYKLEPNPDFVKAVDNLLAERKLDRGATLIVYCSVGERSARAANLLLRSGFRSVYSMVDGFEGDPTAKAGKGWKASKLPWSYQLEPSQAYKSPSL